MAAHSLSDPYDVPSRAAMPTQDHASAPARAERRVMLRLLAAILLVLLAATAAFVFVPAAEVPDTRVAETIHAAPERTRAYFESTRVPGAAPPTLEAGPVPSIRSDAAPSRVVTVRKSELRKAIEGRLKWLGVTDEIVLTSSCVTDPEGNRVCRRLL